MVSTLWVCSQSESLAWSSTEPTAWTAACRGGVNPSLIEHLAELIRQLNRDGISFLVVEHNMPLVLELCDPVVVLAAGAASRRARPGPSSATPRCSAPTSAGTGAPPSPCRTATPR
jgi:hypothetical protein